MSFSSVLLKACMFSLACRLFFAYQDTTGLVSASCAVRDGNITMTYTRLVTIASFNVAVSGATPVIWAYGATGAFAYHDSAMV